MQLVWCSHPSCHNWTCSHWLWRTLHQLSSWLDHCSPSPPPAPASVRRQTSAETIVFLIFLMRDHWHQRVERMVSVGTQRWSHCCCEQRCCEEQTVETWDHRPGSCLAMFPRTVSLHLARSQRRSGDARTGSSGSSSWSWCRSTPGSCPDPRTRRDLHWLVRMIFLWLEHHVKTDKTDSC